jgi:hypothetical protein
LGCECLVLKALHIIADHCGTQIFGLKGNSNVVQHHSVGVTQVEAVDRQHAEHANFRILLLIFRDGTFGIGAGAAAGKAIT